jgi:hypothetical protein
MKGLFDLQRARDQAIYSNFCLLGSIFKGILPRGRKGPSA